MQAEPRTARPGDVCVLLEPAAEQVAEVRQLQMSLQALFGGRPHPRVHLTCQRFVLGEERLFPDIVQHLRTSLAAIRPFPITTRSVVQAEHRFWQSRLLRWRIQVTTEVQNFARLVEDGLLAAGVAPHFPQTSGWVPALVTALETVPERNLDHHLSDIGYPHYLFTGRQVVISRIMGQRQFDILETIQLAGDHCPSVGWERKAP